MKTQQKKVAKTTELKVEKAPGHLIATNREIGQIYMAYLHLKTIPDVCAWSDIIDNFIYIETIREEVKKGFIAIAEKHKGTIVPNVNDPVFSNKSDETAYILQRDAYLEKTREIQLIVILPTDMVDSQGKKVAVNPMIS
jgi:hypothetical protein